MGVFGWGQTVYVEKVYVLFASLNNTRVVEDSPLQTQHEKITNLTQKRQN